MPVWRNKITTSPRQRKENEEKRDRAKKLIGRTCVLKGQFFKVMEVTATGEVIVRSRFGRKDTVRHPDEVEKNLVVIPK